MAVGYPGFNGLPNVGSTTGLDGLPDTNTPDLTADQKLAKNVFQEQVQQFLGVLNPAIVSEDAIADMQEAADSEDTSESEKAGLQASIAAAQMMNVFASPAVRVYVLTILVSLILSILRKMPGTGHVPSWTGVMQALSQGGLRFTMDSAIKAGWAVLPEGSEILTGTWKSNSSTSTNITDQEFPLFAEPRPQDLGDFPDYQIFVPIAPMKNLHRSGSNMITSDGTYYMKVCYGGMLIDGMDWQNFLYYGNPYDALTARNTQNAKYFGTEYYTSSGGHAGGRGRYWDVSFTDQDDQRFKCTKRTTSNLFKQLIDSDYETVQTADGKELLVPREKTDVFQVKFGEDNNANINNWAYDVAAIGKKITGYMPMVWAYDPECVIPWYGSTAPSWTVSPDVKTLKYRKNGEGSDFETGLACIKLRGVHRVENKNPGLLGLKLHADGNRIVEDTDAELYQADEIILVGVKYVGLQVSTPNFLMSKIVIKDVDGKSRFKLKSDKKPFVPDYGLTDSNYSSFKSKYNDVVNELEAAKSSSSAGAGLLHLENARDYMQTLSEGAYVSSFPQLKSMYSRLASLYAYGVDRTWSTTIPLIERELEYLKQFHTQYISASDEDASLRWENMGFEFSAAAVDMNNAYVEEYQGGRGEILEKIYGDWLTKKLISEYYPEVPSDTSKYAIKSASIAEDDDTDAYFNRYHDSSPSYKDRGFGCMYLYGKFSGTYNTPSNWSVSGTVYIDKDMVTYLGIGKPRVAIWSSGELATKDDTAGVKPLPVSNVNLSEAPSVEFEIPDPCVQPFVGAEAKLKMLLDSDADKYTVMATYGCCFTEEIWEEFQKLKKSWKTRKSMRWY